MNDKTKGRAEDVGPWDRATEEMNRRAQALSNFRHDNGSYFCPVRDCPGYAEPHTCGPGMAVRYRA